MILSSVILRAAACALVAASLARVAEPRRATEAHETGCRPPVYLARDYPYEFEPMFDGMKFEKPVRLRQHSSADDTWLVALGRGRIESIRGGRARTILDISDRVELGQQWGLQDIVLHPRFPADRRVFVAYFSRGSESIVASFELSNDGAHFDPRSERVLLRERQRDGWHCVGGLEFDPDGYLHIGWGDGDKRSQDLGYLGGKMLRIDVDAGGPNLPYGIPDDNPFVGTNARAEIFAVGVRNPWRFSVDRATGTLWAGDVGDRHYEEINRIEPGRNYGWHVWEGTTCKKPDGCTREGFTLPVIQHSHNEMCSVTGGYVYRGSTLPELAGRYLYANFCTGTVWALTLEGDDAGTSEPIAHSGWTLGSFAEDRDGELYVVQTRDSPDDHVTPGDDFGIFKLVHRKGERRRAPRLPEASLLQTRCVSSNDYRAPPPGMAAYSLNHPPWEDGAVAYRFVTSTPSVAVPGDTLPLIPPQGSVLIKTLEIDGRPIETQMLVRRWDAGWEGIDYEWSDDGSDALPVARAKTKVLASGQTWSFPGHDGCVVCHDAAREMLLGYRLSQLGTGKYGGTQLADLERQGAIRWREGAGQVPRIPHPTDERTSVEDRARAYLAVNCAHCHQPGGRAGEAQMDLRLAVPLARTGACGRPSSAELPGHEDALLLVPGAPAASLISIRMHAADTSAMPPHRRRVDPVGTALVDQWIRSLESCAPIE